ncbi:hypothetical protein [uncultured Croceitalea sp.]|uniref:hypothetical protein n=1 Tax=uncultured Croceitalea sp. TaxID=1798908 RepID=UPI00330585EA
MRRISFYLFGLLLIVSCSEESDAEDIGLLTQEALMGQWAWKTAIVTDASNQRTGTLNIGDINCFEFDISERGIGRCDELMGTLVEECQTLTRFDISFENTGVYDRNENYANSNVQLNIVENCQVVFHEDDLSESLYSGNWKIQNGQILLTETYRLWESTIYSENRPATEFFDTSTILWNVLSFSTNEMTVFWRTPDQIDFEITFTKK